MVPNPDLVQVLQQFFEPESHLHNFLMKEVNEFEDYALFLRFLENFLCLDFNDSSSTNLLKEIKSKETFSDLIKTCALPCQSCNEIWKKLAQAGISQTMIPNFDVSRDASDFPF